ncbi:MAG: nuclease [Rhodobacteraceae bacterium CG17_big_fil_post_rev_8_21_14_2_50_65_11]|nr:MAG: nuclease [Rhodobacteraceae bacterium CG17_big_fil_post_rev_8_21_14_2_50_65_11]
MRDPFLTMALNNAWANATLFGAIAGLSEEAFAAQRPGFFPSLKATLNHIHEVDLYYLDALEAGGLGRSVYDRDEIGNVAELAKAQAEADQRLAAFCRGLTPAILDESRVTERREGPAQEKVGALLLHLFQHQIHHRGQAHTMVAEAGIDPPQLDDFHLEYGRVPSAAAYWT